MKLVECVPNFSVGNDDQVIQKIVNSITAIKGVTLLDVDSGVDTNRSVVTFVGDPHAVKEAAFQSIRTASLSIDMSKHKGTHPRIGATDVCPLIPISNITMEECVELSKSLGKRVGDELDIPIFLYEMSSAKPSRSNLSVIRSGEYEGLSKKLSDPKWKPDYGPSTFNKKSGATVIGARNFLIAYNINLNSKDKRIATDIAFEIREKGRSKRKPNPKSTNLLDGEIIRKKDGSPIKTKGMFKDVKAVGWYVKEYNRVQISINFNNYKISTIHDVFDAVCKLASDRGARVTGSELVGLIPLEAMLDAGRFYLKKQNASLGVSTNEIIEIAIQSLGLNDIVPFDPKIKIIEYAVNIESDKLVDLDINSFVNEVSQNSPAPGGGSVSALLGSLSASLCSMVASLTYDKKEFFDSKPEMSKTGEKAQILKDELLILIDNDTNAFKAIIEANKLPDSNAKEKENKELSMKKAIRLAIEVPFEIVKLCTKVLNLCFDLCKNSNPNSISDIAVAAESAYAGLKGASMNVLINLRDFDDKKSKLQILKKLDNHLKESSVQHKKIIDNVHNIIKSNG